MSEQQYELAFYGKLVEGSALEKTKELVAQLFKTDVAQIEKMFTGNRVVIRNKLDHNTAIKYVVALKKRGALSQIELMGQPGIAVNLTSPTPEKLVVAASQPKKASMSLNGLPIAGEKVDEILNDAHLDLAPVGVRLEDEKPPVELELHALDDVSLAPVGSVLVENQERPPVSVPDTSHINLAPIDK